MIRSRFEIIVLNSLKKYPTAIWNFLNTIPISKNATIMFLMISRQNYRQKELLKDGNFNLLICWSNFALTICTKSFHLTLRLFIVVALSIFVCLIAILFKQQQSDVFNSLSHKLNSYYDWVTLVLPQEKSIFNNSTYFICEKDALRPWR